MNAYWKIRVWMDKAIRIGFQLALLAAIIAFFVILGVAGYAIVHDTLAVSCKP